MKSVILVVMFLTLTWEPAFAKPGAAEGTEAQSENSSWPITESKMVDRVQTKLISVAGDEPIVDAKGYVCEAIFILAVSSIHGVATRCEHLLHFQPVTLDSCKLNTCESGGNAFNWRLETSHCIVKHCSGASLELNNEEDGGWDVYVQRDCATTEFTQATPSSAGLASNCEPLGGGNGYTFDLCKSETCLNGGDTFNWRSTTGECYYKLCQGTSLEFIPDDPGFDIYTMRDPYCGL